MKRFANENGNKNVNGARCGIFTTIFANVAYVHVPLFSYKTCLSLYICTTPYIPKQYGTEAIKWGLRYNRRTTTHHKQTHECCDREEWHPWYELAPKRRLWHPGSSRPLCLPT
ncbi:hypothetical protein CBL_13895 [Carabus blaptoides fortunei]